MRFHVGFSFKGKVILKWIGMIGLALLSYFGISQMQVLALPSGEDLLGYYEISSTDDHECNIFLGSYESLNRITNQVETTIDYTTANFKLTQTSAVGNAGWQSSNFIVRYKRNNDQQLQLSFKVGNGGDIDACSGRYEPSGYTADNCNAPVVQVYYCPTDDGDMTSSACWKNDLNNSSTRTIYNYAFKTNSWLNNYKNTSGLEYNYIYILFPNYSNTTYGHLPIGKGWNFDYILSDTSVDSTDWDASALNYCSNTGGSGSSSSGGNSVLDSTTAEIINEVNGPIIQGALNDADNFLDTTINNHGVSSIVTAPITLLNGMLSASESCSPLSFNITLGGTTKQVSLPCGSILWNSVSSSTESLINVVIWGLLGFYVCIDLYKFVQDLHDPDKKNDYIMEL